MTEVEQKEIQELEERSKIERSEQIRKLKEDLKQRNIERTIKIKNENTEYNKIKNSSPLYKKLEQEGTSLGIFTFHRFKIYRRNQDSNRGAQEAVKISNHKKCRY